MGIIKDNEENPDHAMINPFQEVLNKKPTYDLVYEDVQEIAITANKYDGKLFGGVVRSFLLRKEDTNDIDIWFTDDKKCEEFIEVISKRWLAIESHKYYGDKYGSKENQEKFRKENKYPFDKNSYIVTSSNTDFSYRLDIVCKDVIPVNDFNVNCVTYDGNKLESHCESLKDELKCIKLKNMSYIPSINNVNDSYREITDGEYKSIAKEYNIHKIRVDRFKHEGWKILDENEENKPNCSMGFISDSIISLSLKNSI